MCNVDFESKRSHTKYCSNKCRKKAEYLRQKEYTLECIVCNKAFNTKTKGSKYCGSSCSNAARKNEPVTKSCEFCKKDFTVNFIRRKTRFCSKSCSTKDTNSKMDREAVNKKISETKKRDFASGKVIHSWAGKKHSQETKDKISKTMIENKLRVGEKNGMYGRSHTKETREKISKTRSEKIVNGEYNSWFSKGTHFSSKLNKEVHYRSSWEKQAYIILDEDDNVISYEPEPFSISYTFDNATRNYIPDILVEFKDKKRVLVEVKPTTFIDYEINQVKFDAARKYCEDNDIIFEIWSESIIKYNTI